MSPNKILNSAISETKIKLIEDIKTVLDTKSIQEKNEPLKLSDLTDVSVDYIRKFTGKVDELNERLEKKRWIKKPKNWYIES